MTSNIPNSLYFIAKEKEEKKKLAVFKDKVIQVPGDYISNI
jgi:hypothetical protein